MKFDITNLELDAVLVALHTAARVNNITFLDNKVPTLTHRMAREMIEEGQATGSLKFDRLMGRALHIDLNDDLVDLTRYGMNNGRLTGVQALFRLCQSKGTEALLHMDDRTDPVTVTAEWLQSYDAINNDDINFAYPERLSLTQQMGRTKRPDVQSAKATTLDDKGMERLEAEFRNRKQHLLDSGVTLPSAEDLANWRRRWEEATPAQREAMLRDDSVKYAYMHQAPDHRTLKDSAGQPIGEVGHPLDVLQRVSRSERLENILQCDDNSDMDRMGRPRNPDYNHYLSDTGLPIVEVKLPKELQLGSAAKQVAAASNPYGSTFVTEPGLQMAPRMVGDQLVSIDAVRESVLGQGKASDLGGSVDMSKPVDKGFGV